MIRSLLARSPVQVGVDRITILVFTQKLTSILSPTLVIENLFYSEIANSLIDLFRDRTEHAAAGVDGGAVQLLEKVLLSPYDSSTPISSFTKTLRAVMDGFDVHRAAAAVECIYASIKVLSDLKRHGVDAKKAEVWRAHLEGLCGRGMKHRRDLIACSPQLGLTLWWQRAIDMRTLISAHGVGILVCPKPWVSKGLGEL